MAKHNASTAQDYNQKGIKLAATGNPKEALQQFDNAISLNYSPLYFGNRAMVQFAGICQRLVKIATTRWTLSHRGRRMIS